MSEDAFELEFLSPDRLELQSMAGAPTRYRRAKAYTPIDAELKAFAGSYEGTEWKAVIHLTPGTGGLIGRIIEAPGTGFEFRPVESDSFQLGMLTLRFRRDTAVTSSA